MTVSRIGRYEIVRPLGKGAMGVVYLARDPSIDREVALKTVRFDSPGASFKLDEAKARFLKEARISGRLQHPHIVTVFDVGEDEGALYLAMEYVPGGNLAQSISAEEPLPVEDRIRIVAEVAQALGHAHERGVIHRDVKPANILLTPSLAAKVSDFGIGKLITGDTDLTSTGQMVGSPSYMSPEQMRGEKLDVRSDIFSLGVVLYQTMTGRKPFPADTLTTLVYQILHEEPPLATDVRPEIPPEISAIVRKCLAKRREDRYADATEVATELGNLLGLTPVMATTTLSESRVKRAGGLSGSGAGRRPPGIPGPSLPPSEPPPIESETDAPTVSVRTGETARPPIPPAPEGAPVVLDRRKTIGLLAASALLVGLMGWAALRTKDDSDTPGKRHRSPTPVVVTATPVVATSPTQVPGSTTPPPEVSGTPGAGTVPVAVGSPVETPVVPTMTPTEGPLLGTVPVGGAPTPTKKPKATPKPTQAIPTQTPVPTPKPADVSYSVRRLVKLAITPDQARVFLDGKYIGIADDWDDAGSGALLVFAKEGKHRLRLAYPNYRDLTVDVTVMSNAADEKVTVKQQMQAGKGEGWPGPSGEFRRPDYRTVGPVKFNVEPADAVVTVNGKNLGRANMWTPQAPLVFPEMAVYDLVLSQDGYEAKAFRVIVSPATEKAEAVVKEKLKKKE